MKLKTIKRSVLIGAISGFYLTFIFIWFTFGKYFFENAEIPDNNTFLQTIYYFFCCSLLLSVYFLLIKNKLKKAKISIGIFIISMLASLFWAASVGGVSDTSVFMFSIIYGSLMGIPFPIISVLGFVPNILFFLGTISSLFVFSKKVEEESLVLNEPAPQIDSVVKK